jgi:hypothetical protein
MRHFSHRKEDSGSCAVISYHIIPNAISLNNLSIYAVHDFASASALETDGCCDTCLASDHGFMRDFLGLF